MKLYKDRDWLYKKYWEEELSSTKIAEICEATPKTILNWMIRFNLKRRTASEERKGKIPIGFVNYIEASRNNFNPNDIVGKKFGRLKVIKLEKIINKAYFYNNKYRNKYLYFCKCDCENTKVTTRTNLLNKDVRSCGCLKIEKFDSLPLKMRLPKGESAFRALFYRYKKDAKRKNLNWFLTKEDFRFLTKQNCFYCGKAPIQISANSKGSFGYYSYNGIDRVDNKEGYTKENGVPCCKKCNHAKNNMSLNEFRDWIKEINNFINQ